MKNSILFFVAITVVGCSILKNNTALLNNCLISGANGFSILSQGNGVVDECLRFAVMEPQNNCDEGLEYNWDFGDGNVLMDGGRNVNHCYSSGGSYPVKVSIRCKCLQTCHLNCPNNPSGPCCGSCLNCNNCYQNGASQCWSYTDTKTSAISNVTISNSTLTCSLNLNNGFYVLFGNTGSVGNSMNFSFPGTPPNGCQSLEYKWYFGDGSIGTGSSVSHIYQSPGNYQAKLVVSCECCCSVVSSVTSQIMNISIN